MKPPLNPVTMARLLAGMLALALTLLPAQAQVGAAQPGPQLTLPRISLRVGFHHLDVQVARRPQERQIGLMYRRELPEYEGMLFVFDAPAVQCFWMKNTLIALTAAFIADDGSIVNLADMAPESTDSHCSTEPVRYVLETNQGWFTARHIAAGRKVDGLPASRP